MEGKHHSRDYDRDVFDVVGYLEDVWGPEALKANPLTKDIMDDVHTLVQKLDLPENSKQLDFGCGPSIHMVLSSSRLISEIVMTEYAAQNRRGVVDWLKGADFGFKWDHLFEYIGQKEGRSANEVENRSRAAIKDVLACDTDHEAIFGAAQLPQFDLITTCLCLEAACKELPAYNIAISKLASYLKPGGHMVIAGVLDQTYYTVKDKVFSSLNHSKNDIDTALNAAGFKDAQWYIHDMDVKYNCVCDTSGYFSLVTRKSKDM